MSRFSYSFVALVFIALAVSFVASTASIITEFRDTDLAAMLSAYSYLFVFFPTLGIVALAAFYIPAVVFTDIYMTHAKLGRLRYAVGFAGAVALAWWFASTLQSKELRGIWEIAPTVLAENQRQPRTCLEGNNVCVRPVLDVISDLRAKALDRMRISPFIRQCNPDALMDPDPERTKRRYCFPAGELLDADRCCSAQRAFARQVHELWQNPARRSNAAALDQVLLFFKSFFVVIIMLIGILLIGWKRTLRDHYGAHSRPMERGLQIGAIAMMLWPVMDYAYQQTSDIVYGPAGRFPLRLSLVVIPWALLLTFYFADKVRIELARAVQIVGSALSGIAILRYQDISDWSSKLVGLGAAELTFAILVVLSIVILIMLLKWLVGTLRGEEAHELEEGRKPPPLT